MSKMVFNQIGKTYLSIGRDWSMPAWAPIEREYIDVPERPGAVQAEMKTGMRRFPLPIVIHAKSFEDKETFLEDMAAWLIHKEPKPLVFSKYPNRTLYAQIEGAPDFSEMWRMGKGTLQIVCPDPYKYSLKQTVAIESGAATFFNKGTIPVFPIIKGTVLSDLTHLQVFDDERYFQIGEAASVEQIVKKREERMLNENMASLVGWSSSGLTVDGGTVTGSMETNGYSFGAASYGSDTITGWRGPSVKKSVPQAPIKDFKIRVPIVFKNPSIDARGRIEILLLDEQSVDFGKMAMKRTGGGSYGNIFEARAGGTNDWKYFANYAGVNGFEWRNFDGIIEISRINDVWSTYTAMVDPVTKKHTARAWFTHNDIQKKYVRNLAQIQLHIARSGMSQPMVARIGGIQVFRINPVTMEQTPVMATMGDEFELNFQTKKIYLNGALRPDLKAFGGKFFGLPPGSHTLLMEPAQNFAAQLEWEEGYL